MQRCPPAMPPLLYTDENSYNCRTSGVVAWYIPTENMAAALLVPILIKLVAFEAAASLCTQRTTSRDLRAASTSCGNTPSSEAAWKLSSNLQWQNFKVRSSAMLTS